jgi:hypothetical protein
MGVRAPWARVALALTALAAIAAAISPGTTPRGRVSVRRHVALNASEPGNARDTVVYAVCLAGHPLLDALRDMQDLPGGERATIGECWRALACLASIWCAQMWPFCTVVTTCCGWARRRRGTGPLSSAASGRRQNAMRKIAAHALPACSSRMLVTGKTQARSFSASKSSGRAGETSCGPSVRCALTTARRRHVPRRTAAEWCSLTPGRSRGLQRLRSPEWPGTRTTT